MHQLELPEFEAIVADEVGAILDEHFPSGLVSPTDAAILRRRAKVICRDHANDDGPSSDEAAITA